jgi:hypothetical protein
MFLVKGLRLEQQYGLGLKQSGDFTSDFPVDLYITRVTKKFPLRYHNRLSKNYGTDAGMTLEPPIDLRRNEICGNTTVGFHGFVSTAFTRC